MWHPYTKFWLWPGAAVGGICTIECVFGQTHKNLCTRALASGCQIKLWLTAKKVAFPLILELPKYFMTGLIITFCLNAWVIKCPNPLGPLASCSVSLFVLFL